MVIDYDDLPRLARGYEYEYQVRKLYNSMIASDISKQLGISLYFNEDRDYFYISGLEKDKIAQRDVSDYDELLTKIESLISSQGGKDTANLISKWTPYLKDFSIEDKIGILYDNSPISISISDLLEIIYYALTGEYGETRTIGVDFENKAKKYWENNKDYENPLMFIASYVWVANYGTWIDLGEVVDSIFDGLTIKLFQNGKIQIKGLTSTEWDRLVDLRLLIKGR